MRDYLNLFRKLISPHQLQRSLDDIDLELLFRDGYRTLFLDVDNTLISYKQREVSLQKEQWVEFAKSLGFSVFLVSNNSSHRRIERVAKQLGVKGVFFAMKPLAYAVHELAQDYHLDLNCGVFIGDKILCDVVLGNWLGGYTVLVEPMDQRLSLLRSMQRAVELFIITKLNSRL